MRTNRTVNDRIGAWLRDVAPDELPDVVLGSVFDRTRTTPQRRLTMRWRDLLPARMNIVVAGVATVIVVFAAGALFRGLDAPDVGGVTVGPTSSLLLPSAAPESGLAPVSLTGQVAFGRRVDGNTDIYVMNLDRSGLKRLTADPEVDAGPAWSADAKRIVFTRGTGQARDVFAMNADGTDPVQLTSSAEGEDLPAFSPDGSQIAFIRYVDPDYFDLFVMAADGSGERRIWHKEGVWAAGPRWSPDGSSIYLSEDETGGGQIDVVRIDLATGALTRLTVTPGDDSTFAISPGGTTIAFQSDRSPGGIFLMDADGSNVRHLVGTWQRGYPMSWSPDGLHLIFARPDGWLYLVDADGEGFQRWAEGGPGVAWKPSR
jgi:TolB protein